MATTRLSRSATQGTDKYGRSHGLARSSHRVRRVTSVLALLAAFGASGCIVPEPPSYDPPRTTAPALDGFGATPTNLFPTPVPRSQVEGFQLKVPYRSEDAGQEIWAGLYINYGNNPSRLPNNYRRYEPSTYDDDDREINISIRGGLDPGCYTISLFVTHMPNTLVDESGELYLNEEAAKDDLGVATWFFNVEPVATDPTTLWRCPARATVP